MNERTVRVAGRTVHNWLVRRCLARAAVCVLLVLEAAGCAKLHARTQPIGPPLETPPPPPRVLVPLESEPIAPPSAPIGEATGRPPARGAPPRVPPRTERTETPAPRVPAEEAPETRTLQTTANAAEAEQNTRARLAVAARALRRIDYRSLGVDAKAQYDIAKRFVAQAEEALKVKNFVFAAQLADKAAALAALLLKP